MRTQIHFIQITKGKKPKQQQQLQTKGLFKYQQTAPELQSQLVAHSYSNKKNK